LIGGEAILFWSGGVGVIHSFLDSGEVDNIGLLFLIAVSPFIALTYVSAVDQKNQASLK